MTGERNTILFLCTGNSARSIMAEAVTNKIASHRFVAYSAGSNPTGVVNPHVSAFLAFKGHDVSTLRSKSWDEFHKGDQPDLDFLITVCDDAREACPIFPNRPAHAHWGLEDPARFTGSDMEIRAKISEIYGQIERRVELLAALPMETLDNLALRERLQKIHDGDAP